jgi:hypothetical protein
MKVIGFTGNDSAAMAQSSRPLKPAIKQIERIPIHNFFIFPSVIRHKVLNQETNSKFFSTPWILLAYSKGHINPCQEGISNS